ncbi:MAG: hypothetical protein ACM3S1_03325 [Hyphomicrobiales bacterium]
MAIVLVAAAAALSFALASGDSPHEHPSSAEIAADRLPHTSPGQAAILEDGVVTQDEYESAVNATIACVEAQGFDVTDPVQQDGRLAFEFATKDTNEGAHYQAAYLDCHAQHQRDVDSVWAKQLAEANPPSADQLAASRAAIAGCLAEHGVPGVATDAALMEMVDAVQRAGQPQSVFYRCAGEAQAATGVLPEE